MNTPKFSNTDRMADNVPQPVMTLDSIANESWLINLLKLASEASGMDVPDELMEELTSIMAECASGYDKKNKEALVIPLIKDQADFLELGKVEARAATLLARVAEITISLYAIRKEVTRFWDKCEERINRYSVVNKELTNDRKRILYYRAVLAPLYEKQSKLDQAFDIASRIEKHLTQIHFSVKEMKDIGNSYLQKSTKVDYGMS